MARSSKKQAVDTTVAQETPEIDDNGVQRAHVVLPDGIGVEASQLGSIQKLPGIGRDAVKLDTFQRTGLAQLASASWLRSELCLYDGKHFTMRAYDDAKLACIGCGQTLGEMFEYTNEQLATADANFVIPNYEVARFVPKRRDANSSDMRRAVYACFNCAASRDTMVAAMIEKKVIANFASMLSREDYPQDVFAWVALTINNDRLSRANSAYADYPIRMCRDQPIAASHSRIWDGGRKWHEAKAAYMTGKAADERIARAKRLLAAEAKAAEKAAKIAKSKVAPTE